MSWPSSLADGVRSHRGHLADAEGRAVEVVVVPVSDVERALRWFHVDQIGFTLDVDSNLHQRH